jgi:ribonuclease VapC
LIVDSSALVAILKDEPEADHIGLILVAADALAMSTATYVETSIVVDRLANAHLSQRLDELIGALAITLVPLSETQARIARVAYTRYGKHSGHPARLNFGDCFAYALAKDRGEPLLFKGNDFAQTDLVRAG